MQFNFSRIWSPNEDDNIFEKGDLDAMFKRIVGEESQTESAILLDYEPVVHSYPGSAEENADTIAGPWIVTLEFLK